MTDRSCSNAAVRSAASTASVASDCVLVTLVDRTRRERKWDVDHNSLLRALQVYVDECLRPTWGVSARLRWSTDFVPDAWALVLVDGEDERTLGYHHLTVAGFPMAVVSVGAVRRAGKSVAALAAHELAEMLVNPSGNVLVQRPHGRLYALEICDPVKDLTFALAGVPVADFVLPGWFMIAGTWRYRAPDGRLDWMGAVRQPFQVHATGYVATVIGGRWTRQER
jgi:hypothetical protein